MYDVKIQNRKIGTNFSRCEYRGAGTGGAGGAIAPPTFVILLSKQPLAPPTFLDD